MLQIERSHVDYGVRVLLGYRVPRDIFSIQNGFDLFNHKLRLTALFDYKGGYSIQDGANNFQCNTGPFACRETQDPTAPLAVAGARDREESTARRSAARATRRPPATS